MLGRQAFHLQMPLSQATCSLKDMLHPNEGAGALMLSTQGLSGQRARDLKQACNARHRVREPT